MSELSDALLAMAKVGDGNVPFVMAEEAANEITELEQQNQNMANAIIALSGCGSPDNITDRHLQQLFESLPDDACPIEGK